MSFNAEIPEDPRPNGPAYIRTLARNVRNGEPPARSLNNSMEVSSHDVVRSQFGDRISDRQEAYLKNIVEQARNKSKHIDTLVQSAYTYGLKTIEVQALASSQMK